MVTAAIAVPSIGNSLSPVVMVIAGLGLAYIVRVAVAMRQGAVWLIRAMLVTVIGSAAAYAFLVQSGALPATAELLAVIAGVIVFAILPRRSRHIPAEVRRQVIKRDLKGKRVKPGEYHVDHTWPHALGGSNTVDNLRVIPKKENLKKGKKAPTLRDWL